jgi:ABC-type amino acid transport substrate-binding protein
MHVLRFTVPFAFALAVLSVQADTVTSSASSAASKSVESLSTSVSQSSESSSGDKKTAQGAYVITQVAQVAERPGYVALTLAPAAGQAQGFTLALAQALAAEQGLVTGETVAVQHRTYGLAFAKTMDAAPFLLAVDDLLRRDFESVKI